MTRFLSELKRRNVLRVAGLYIGIGFMAIEAGSILLPLYGFGENVFRIWVFIVLAGFPLALVASWFLEITAAGILTDEEAREQQARPLMGRRKGDYVVAGVLLVALLSSLTLNYVSFSGEATETAPPQAVSLLIAEFDNASGEPLFTGTVEEALQIGLEGASFIASYPRAEALRLARDLSPAGGLDAQTARLLSVRQGINLVVTGETHAEGSSFRIDVRALDPVSGEVQAEASVLASSKLEVLQAISDLATDMRKALGDLEVEAPHYTAETLSASNIEAVKAFLDAQAAASERRWQEAVQGYEQAVALDPGLGRAWSGWALAAAELGQAERAERLWEEALQRIGGMSPRERFRTLGLYYAIAKQDYDKAVDAYRELVKAYPADTAGYNNLAVASFLTLDFDAAQAAGRRALEHFPNSILYRSNFALYSMYAGDLEAAVAAAAEVAEERPEYAVAHLPAFVSAALGADLAVAQAAAERMQAGDASLANLAAADLRMFSGEFAEAEALLAAGRAEDAASDNFAARLTKSAMLADLLLAGGDQAGALAVLEGLDEQARGATQQVQLALALLAAGAHDRVLALAQRLDERLQPQPRAWGRGLRAAVALAEGDTVAAVDLLRRGLGLADLWWLRRELGRAYLERGDAVEALTEFEVVDRRLAEGAVLFLDDKPTLRQVADLPVLLATTQEQLGMPAARGTWERFIRSQRGGARAAALAKARAALEDG